MKKSDRINLFGGPLMWWLLARSATGQTSNAPSPPTNAAPSSGVPAPSPGTAPTGPTAATPTRTMAPVAATELPTFADRDCWDNFTQIFFDLVQKVPFSENTYTICPNRVYRVGYAFDGNQCCRDGDFPLAPRANTHFKCGEDGALSNNCTVVGGSFHVLFNEFVYAEELSGVTVQGFTFQSPELHTIQAAATGSLTFIDCVIKDQMNRGPIYTFYDRPERRLSRAYEEVMGETARERIGYVMSEEYMEGVRERAQQRAQEDRERGQDTRTRRTEDVIQTITMEKCIFMNCSQGAHGKVPPSYGVVSALTRDNIFVITNSVFADNSYDGTTLYGQTGYAVSMINSDLVMTNSCFIDNRFAGFGTVEVFGEATYQVENNYVTGTDAGVHCRFISHSDTRPSDPGSTTCIDADATSCQAGSAYQRWLALKPGTAPPRPAPSTKPARPTLEPAPATSGVSVAQGSILYVIFSLLPSLWVLQFFMDVL